MSKATEITKQAEIDMKNNWDKRLPKRIEEQNEKHKINQKINMRQEIKAKKRKVEKRRAKG